MGSSLAGWTRQVWHRLAAALGGRGNPKAWRRLAFSWDGLGGSGRQALAQPPVLD